MALILAKFFLLFILAVLVVRALRARGHSLLGRAGEAQVGQVLQRLLPEVANDLILPDGRSGLTQIGHLALTCKGLLVVETKDYSGSIFGYRREPTWTQVLGRSRHSFQNPLRQNYAHIKAVEALGLSVPVLGLVVFAGSASFPHGMPPGVCRLCDLGEELASLRQDAVPAAFQTAWERVLASARTDRHAKQEHLQILRDRNGAESASPAPVLLLLLLALVWPVGGWLVIAAVLFDNAVEKRRARARRITGGAGSA